MRTATQLIQWFWWRHPIMLPASIASVILAQCIYWFAVAYEIVHMEPATVPLHLSFFTLFPTAIAAFAYGSNLDLTSGKSAHPRWLYNLPIGNMSLAVVPMTLMVLAIGLAWIPYSLALLHFGSTQTGDDVSNFSCVYYVVILPWLYLCSVGLWVQATSWWPFRYAIFRVIALMAVVYVLLWAIVKTVNSINESRDEYPSILDALIAEGSWQLDAIAFVSLLLGAVSVVISVSFARQITSSAEIGWNNRLWIRFVSWINESWQALSPTALTEDRTFSSYGEALQWRNWNQLGRIPVMVMLCFTLCAVYYNFGIVLLSAAVFLCAIAGPTMGKNKFWKGVKPFSTFIGTLPVTDNMILKQRVVNTIRVSLACWGIAGLGSLIWFLGQDSRAMVQACSIQWSYLFGSEYGELEYGIRILAAAVLMSLYMAIAVPFPGLAVGLTGRKKIHITVQIVGSIVGVASFITLLLVINQIIAKLGTNEMRSDANALERYTDYLYSTGFQILCIALIIKFALAGLAIWLQKRRGIFDWKPIWKYGPHLFAAYAAIVALFWLLLYPTNAMFHWLAVILAIAFPCASLLMAPVALDWNRHR